MNIMRDQQAARILAILDAAGRNFLVERTPEGWRVETEERDGSDGYASGGATLTDALAHVSGALLLDVANGVDLDAGVAWMHDAEVDGGGDIDEPVRFAVEEPVEFAPVAGYVDDGPTRNCWMCGVPLARDGECPNQRCELFGSEDEMALRVVNG